MPQCWRTDGRKPSVRANSAGLSASPALKKKSSTQSVPSARRKSGSIGPTGSTVRFVGSGEDISATQELEVLSSEDIKPKPSEDDKETVLPQDVNTESVLDYERQEFLKFKKQFMHQQNEFIDRYARLRELEAKSGVPASGAVGEVRVLSVTNWPVHDLLLVAESAPTQHHSEIKGVLGPKILQQLTVQLTEIRDEVLSMGTELMRRRLEILKFIRAIQRNENRVFVYEGQNIEWQTKNAELDEETVKLRDLVLTTVKNLEIKLTQSLDATKIPWMDRDNMLKKIERLQKEFSILKKSKQTENTSEFKKVLEELHRERACVVRMKEMVASAEERASAARARCAELERQLSANTGRPKWVQNPKQLQHSNCRGSSHDASGKKSDPQKSDATIEVLSNQRDSLQSRVKELQERATMLTQEAQKRETELMSRVESLLSKLEDQEQKKESSETLAQEMSKRLRDLQEKYNILQKRSRELVEAQHIKCLDYLPGKVPNSSENLEILYELEATKNALGRVRKELERSRTDKKDLPEQPENEMAEGVLSEDQTITNLQKEIEELTENKETMLKNLTCYENQITTLRLEVSLLRSFNDYKSCNREIPQEELEKQVYDLCLQVKQLTREREALASEAMTRSLLLERHERSAELFARVTRARRELAAQLVGTADTSPTALDGINSHEMKNVMSKTYLSSASTWSALCAERARVLRLEEVVHAQAQQLDRESLVRVKQDRRRAQLERKLIRTWAGVANDSQSKQIIKEANTSTSDSLYFCKAPTKSNVDATCIE